MSIQHHDSNLIFMINIYRRLSGAVSLLWINKTSTLKNQLMSYKSKAEEGKFPLTWIKWSHLEMCNLFCREIFFLRFISAKLLAPPTSIICFKYGRNWTCPRDWMSSGSMATTHALQWSVCRLLFHAKSPYINTHTNTHSSEVLLHHPVLQRVPAWVEVFLVTHMHTHGLCFQCEVSGRHHVKDSVRWSLMLRPELCRRDVFVPSTGGGSRADLIVCTSKCTMQHQCAAPLYIVRKRLISALVRS